MEANATTGAAAPFVPATGRIEREPSLRERAEERLLGAILSGELAAGSLHSAPVLAHQFGVSATPVREAMMNLARRGLVEVQDRQGFRILGISDEDMREIVSLRELLEGRAMEILAGHLPASEVPRLRADAAEIVRAGDTGDMGEYLSVDRRFHFRLLELAGNRRLTAHVMELRALTRLVGIPSIVGTTAFRASNEEHLELLDHLESGDAAAAGQLIRRHVRHSVGAWGGLPEES